jgi:predicted LPLAT superfamily acyltransferase
MQHTERGNVYGLRLACWLSLTFGRRLTRLVVYGTALYFGLAVPRARKASKAYLVQVLERPVRWRDVYRHILSFASTIHDRFYLLNNQSHVFDIRVFGSEAIYEHRDRKAGALLFGAHVGSFEILLNHARNHAVNTCVAMYPDNARLLNSVLAAINPQAMQGIVALGQFNSMLTIHEKLQEGAMVGILADRAVGADQYITLPFLGAPARFPTGPFRMAAMLGQPVYFMTGLYQGGNRYDVHFEVLADFSQPAPAGRAAAVHETLQKYVAALEKHCRAAPFNWFNFFDFWESAGNDTH